MKRIVRFVCLLSAQSLMFLSCQTTGDFVTHAEYLNDFDWMVKTFTENDAGFKYYLETKGIKDYTRHTEAYRKKIGQAKCESEFLSLMNEWLFYFRKHHIGVYFKESGRLTASEKNSIRATYGNEELIHLSEADFLHYLKENSNILHPIEGVWTSPSCDIGIVRSSDNKQQFDAFIIKADSIYWMPKQKKAELILQPDGNFHVTYRRKDHIKTETSLKWLGPSKGVISMGNFYWIKLNPEVNFSAKDSLLMASLSNKLYLKKISGKTVYLRIPSFLLEEKKAIDDLLARNNSLIRSTPNLIVDIRNGTGGSDGSHFGLIPYYYTQPIRNVGQLFYATELHAMCYEKYAKELNDVRNSQIAKNMRDTLGKYIHVKDYSKTHVLTLAQVSKYPSKIAIICNQYNGSADEGFLYMARQSYKVKIFGKPTAGAFDFSNLNMVDFPNGKYTLCLTTTVSKRYPEYKIDDMGIQPDFYLDDDIRLEDWVEYVQSIIEENG